MVAGLKCCLYDAFSILSHVNFNKFCRTYYEIRLLNDTSFVCSKSSKLWRQNELIKCKQKFL